MRRDSVREMRVAVASLSATVKAASGERVELAEWTAQRRAARGASTVPPLVSSSEPRSALAAWTELQRRRLG
jgi:hypothetical protein